MTNESPHIPLAHCEPTALPGSATYCCASPYKDESSQFNGETEGMTGTGSQGWGTKEEAELIPWPRFPSDPVHVEARVTGAAVAW